MCIVSQQIINKITNPQTIQISVIETIMLLNDVCVWILFIYLFIIDLFIYLSIIYLFIYSYMTVLEAMFLTHQPPDISSLSVPREQ